MVAHGPRASSCSYMVGTTIMMNRANRVLLASGLLAVGTFLMTDTGAAQQTVVDWVPNLVALPASDYSVISDAAGTRLVYSTSSWNNGAGPLELRAGAFRQTGPNDYTRDVSQRIYRSDGTYYDRFAGAFEYHPEHNHFHFEDYALVTLRPVNAPGASDRQSAKTTFCVMDSMWVNLSLPRAPQSAVYTTCGASYQGMSVGWGDWYGPTLAGQSFDLAGSPSGNYDVITQIDPQQRLLETNEGDNLACVRININIALRTVSRVGECTQGGVTISAISPNSAFQNSILHNVTISGSGFTSGVAVGFENGSGPAPVASNVEVVNATTITLTVSVKSGGPRKERLWDVRVGSAVLQRGFKVMP
jgi:hypothetical protein